MRRAVREQCHGPGVGSLALAVLALAVALSLVLARASTLAAFAIALVLLLALPLLIPSLAFVGISVAAWRSAVFRLAPGVAARHASPYPCPVWTWQCKARVLEVARDDATANAFLRPVPAGLCSGRRGG